jgi:signal transduction histidine kinase
MDLSRDHYQRCVLILAPTGRDSQVLGERLRRESLEPFACEDMRDLCESMREGAGTAIVAEEALTHPELALLSDTLENQPEWSDFPLIVMASSGTDPDRLWEMLTESVPAANVVILDRPALTRTLLAAIRTSLRSRAMQYRVAEELRRRREAETSLEAANEEMKAFSYSVSHDLRAPLRVVKSFSAMLVEDYGDRLEGEARMYLERIEAGANRMARLIDDMLKLSRVARRDIVATDVDLSSVAEEIVAELRGQEQQRAVEIEIEPDVIVHADLGLMRIALENLLGNAWKYTVNKPRARIEFGTTESDGKKAFFVRDNGAGFDTHYADKLFLPFQRLHADSEFSGTGVGLATVDRAIRRSGGRIWAESRVGEGSVFYFTLG